MNKRSLCFWGAFLPPILWMVVIFTLSHQPKLPGPEEENLRFIFMKSAHMAVYGGLYFWWWRAVLLWQNRPHFSPNSWRKIWPLPQNTSQDRSKHLNKKKLIINRNTWLLPFLFTLLFAFSDELHQFFIPGRTATLRDVGFDMVGVGLTMLVIRRITPKKIRD